MSIDEIDDMVLEYLLFRGFTGTFKSLQNDIDQDSASKMVCSHFDRDFCLNMYIHMMIQIIGGW